MSTMMRRHADIMPPITTDETEETIDEVVQGVTPRMEAPNWLLGVGETACLNVCCWSRRMR